MLRLKLIVLCGLMISIPRLEAKPTPKKIYLSIGLGHYADSRWPRLNFAGKDAEDFGKALDGSFDVGRILSDHGRDAALRRDDILTALTDLSRQNLSEDDTVIVYISTHGTLAPVMDQGRLSVTKFLVASDTQYDRVAETGLKMPEVLTRFQALKSRRKALIIDACYSGGGKAHITPDMARFLARQKAGSLQSPVEDIDESTGVYTAAAWGEEAQEDPVLKNGVYTHFLLKALHSDLNGDGATQLSEAHTEAAALVIAFTQGAQHPSAQVEIVGQDPVIVKGSLRQKGQPLLLAWRRELRDYLVSFNGQWLGTLNKGVIALPEGRGRLELIDPKSGAKVRTAKVELQANETYLLESFLAEDRPHDLRLTTGLSRFVTAPARAWISNHALLSTGLAYQYRDAFAWADLGVSLDFFSRRETTVRVNAERRGEAVGERDASQRLGGLRFDIKLRREDRIDRLSAANRQWQTRWLSAIGPSYLQLERSLDTFDKHEVSGAEGLGFEQGFEVYWNFRHLSWQVLASYAIYRDQWTPHEKPVPLLSVTTAVGLSF